MICPRLKQYILSVSEDMATHIKTHADILGITETEYIRECVSLCLKMNENNPLTKADFKNIPFLWEGVDAS
jgi:hypothetical protein